jgi:hypothetical protein
MDTDLHSKDTTRSDKQGRSIDETEIAYNDGDCCVVICHFRGYDVIVVSCARRRVPLEFNSGLCGSRTQLTPHSTSKRAASTLTECAQVRGHRTQATTSSCSTSNGPVNPLILTCYLVHFCRLPRHDLITFQCSYRVLAAPRANQHDAEA